MCAPTDREKSGVKVFHVLILVSIYISFKRVSVLFAAMSVALHYSFRKIDHHSLCDSEPIIEANVEQVYLKGCDLINFPGWIMRLRNVTHLSISNNAIGNVPAALSLLSSLNYLDMSDNQLTVMLPTFFELTELRYLDVSGNFVRTIPKGKHE